MRRDVVLPVALLELQADLAEVQAVDPDLAAVERLARLRRPDRDGEAHPAVDGLGAEQFVGVLLVDAQLQGPGHHLVRLNLRQRELLALPQLDAVDAEGRLHPVLHAGAVHELAQFERDVERFGEIGDFEVDAEEAGDRVVVEDEALHLARRLPPGDDLLDAQARPAGDTYRLEEPIVAGRHRRLQQDVVRIGPATRGRGAGRAGTEAPAAEHVHAGDTNGLRLRRIGRERQLPRHAGRRAGLQQERDVGRLAAHKGH